MADENVVAEGAGTEQVEAPDSGKPATGPVGLDQARSARAAKLAAYRAGSGQAAQAPVVTPTPDGPKPAAPAPVVEAKPDEPDPATAKGIEAIEKRDKRQREQFAAVKAEHEATAAAREAAIARREAELEGKTTNLDALKKLPPAKRALEALRAVGLDDEEAMEIVARQTYALSKSGKADPKAKPYADQVARERELDSTLEEIKRQQAELAQELKSRDARATLEQFQSKYLDEAVKAVPAEPSFIGLAMKANAGKARGELLALGQRMEREATEADGGVFDPSHTPSHAEVIKRYEDEKRARYKDDGFSDEQIASLLKPGSAAKPAPSRTLDPTQRPATPIINGTGVPTRAEKIDAARAARLKANVTQQ